MKKARTKKEYIPDDSTYMTFGKGKTIDTEN